MTTGTVPVSRRERRLATLRRRADHLQERIDAHPELTGLSYDRRELSALRWALRMLEQHPVVAGAPT